MPSLSLSHLSSESESESDYNQTAPKNFSFLNKNLDEIRKGSSVDASRGSLAVLYFAAPCVELKKDATGKNAFRRHRFLIPDKFQPLAIMASMSSLALASIESAGWIRTCRFYVDELTCGQDTSSYLRDRIKVGSSFAAFTCSSQAKNLSFTTTCSNDVQVPFFFMHRLWEE